MVQLYGEPDSRSPSTKDRERLELLYYAFDWADPDLPQVMEMLCTVEKDGKPGRVVEIYAGSVESVACKSNTTCEILLTMRLGVRLER